MGLKKAKLSSDFKLHWIFSHCISKNAEGGLLLLEWKAKAANTCQNGELLFENWQARYAY